MKRFLIATLALGFLGAVASAQTTTTPAPTPTPTPMQAPAAPAAAPAAAAQPSGKEAHAQCVAETKGQGLKGAARKAAIDECFAKLRPDLALAHKCVLEGKGKGLAGKELGAYVKQCKSAT